MKEAIGDIWKLGQGYPICVTTNGIINSKGSAVMGKGIALEAAHRYPDLPKLLGVKLKESGNNVYQFNFDSDIIITFPTKHYWWFKSSTDLIRKSTEQLLELADANPAWDKIYLPRPGCGAGGLSWVEDVRSIAENFDDRFIIVSLEK